MLLPSPEEVSAVLFLPEELLPELLELPRPPPDVSLDSAASLMFIASAALIPALFRVLVSGMTPAASMVIARL